MNISLYDLNMGKKGRIQQIDIKDQKRLFELGIIKGQFVEKKYESFDRNMCAVKIAGATIGVKADLCKKIYIEEGDVFE